MGKKKGKVGKWGEKIEKPPEKRGEMGKCGAAGRKYGKTQRNLGGKRAIWVGEGETSHSIPPGGRVSMVLWRLRLRMRSRRARGAAAPSHQRMRSCWPPAPRACALRRSQPHTRGAPDRLSTHAQFGVAHAQCAQRMRSARRALSRGGVKGGKGGGARRMRSASRGAAAAERRSGFADGGGELGGEIGGNWG